MKNQNMKSGTRVVFVPETSENRTAFVATVTEITEAKVYFTEPHYKPNDTPTWMHRATEDGSPLNGNCGTPYALIQVPDTFTTNDLRRIQITLSEELGYAEKYGVEKATGLSWGYLRSVSVETLPRFLELIAGL